MSEPFSILQIPSDARRHVEQLGSKPKFWFVHEGEDWLFKEARENTGEDWSEKVASEIAALLELPTHYTELANWQGKPGSAVRSFLSAKSTVLVHGNELLGGLIANYDKDKLRGQSDHTFDNIVKVIEKLFPVDKARREAAFAMVGYLIFDALVGNTDRHHQNWGVILEMRLEGKKPAYSFKLAPTFDHASSLGRELTDDSRERRLQENGLERYIRNGRGGIFLRSDVRHGLSPLLVAEMLAQRFPEFFRPWQTRVAALSVEQFSELLDRVPKERMSDAACSFTFEFLCVSRQLILKML